MELEQRRAKQKATEEARRKAQREKLAKDGLQAAGAKVVLDGGRAHAAGSGGGGGGGEEDEGEGELEIEGEEEDEDDDRPVHARRAGYTAADEQYAREMPSEGAEREEYASLMRFLEAKKEGKLAAAVMKPQKPQPGPP